jgi:hypothetical protein
MGSAQDRKIKGGVEIKRGTVDVFGPYHIGPSCSAPFSYSTMISPTPRDSGPCSPDSDRP